MIADNYIKINKSIADTALKAGRSPEDIALLAVSKTYPASAICELYSRGCLHFGESRVQEACGKMDELNRFTDITFDLIGQLQTNKVKQAVGKFRLIHSVDRFSLAEALQKAARQAGVVQDILLQVSLAGEVQKGGVPLEELSALFDAVLAMENLRIKGFMTIPPYDENPEVSRPYFRQLKELFDMYRMKYPAISVLSMGMSGDYKVAVEEGATLVRIGTALFGSRC